MPQRYMSALEPAEVVQRIVRSEKKFEGIKHSGVDIRCLFCEEPENDRGRTCLARIRKIGGLQEVLISDSLEDGVWHDPGTVVAIVFHYFAWQSLTQKQRDALVFHELCHLEAEIDDESGDWKFRIVGHDIEEFNSVVAKFGAWMPDLDKFMESVRTGQKTIDVDEAAAQ